MIDDNKIEEAKKSFIADKKILGVMAMNDLACGFKEGAKWAINEFLKNLLHPASEEPKPNDSYILYEYKSDEGKFSFRFHTEIICEYVNWEAFVSAENITRWLYIDDLFPKEGGEHD